MNEREVGMTDTHADAVLTCDDVREMAGAFVLGALEPSEEGAIRAHLASCADAHEEIAELGGVLPALAEIVPMIEPPAALKGRIMAAAAAELAGRDGARTAAAFPASATGELVGAIVPAVVSASTPATSSEPIAFPTAPARAERDARRGRPSTGTWVLRIAAVLAIAALGGWNLLLQSQLSAGRTYEQAVAQVLRSASQPGALTAIMSADVGSGSGLAAVSSSGDVTLAMQGLEPTSGDQVYEAWVIGGNGTPVPLGGFKVGANGTASFTAGGLPATPGIVLALTREPGPGATTPTSPVVSKGVATAG